MEDAQDADAQRRDMLWGPSSAKLYTSGRLDLAPTLECGEGWQRWTPLQSPNPWSAAATLMCKGLGPL